MKNININISGDLLIKTAWLLSSIPNSNNPDKLTGRHILVKKQEVKVLDFSILLSVETIFHNFYYQDDLYVKTDEYWADRASMWPDQTK